MPVDATSGERVADLVARVVREFRGSVLPPRGAPYFGLDMGIDFDPAALASLSDPGIFRKYELVLLLGGGLGGIPRWLAARLGCSIVAVEDAPGLLAAAHRLNERAHMGHAVRFVAAQPARLPVRDRTFTHAWILQPVERVSPDVLAAVYQALRPGGHLALQALGPVASEAPASLRDACAEAGFEASTIRLVPCAELPPAFRTVRAQLARVADLAALPHADGGVWSAEAGAGRELLQVHALRPS